MAINVTKQNGSLWLVYTHASAMCEVQDCFLFLKWSNAYRYKECCLCMKVEIQVLLVPVELSLPMYNKGELPDSERYIGKL